MPSSQVLTPLLMSLVLDIESLHKQLAACVGRSAALNYTQITFAGEDAQDFLQGQLTLDLTQLQPDTHRLSAWCNAKGRVWALLRIWRSGQGFEVLIAQNQAEAFIKRMRMFVLRAQVVITQQNAQVHAEIGPGGLNDGCMSVTDNTTLLHHGADHRLLIDPPNQAPRDEVAESYRGLRILAGEPYIDQATQEKFLPQSLGLSELGGLHFNKGCYVGQEIVARVHYRGKTPQRLNSAIDPSEQSLEGKSVLSDIRAQEARIVQWVENIKA